MKIWMIHLAQSKCWLSQQRWSILLNLNDRGTTLPQLNFLFTHLSEDYKGIVGVWKTINKKGFIAKVSKCPSLFWIFLMVNKRLKNSIDVVIQLLQLYLLVTSHMKLLETRLLGNKKQESRSDLLETRNKRSQWDPNLALKPIQSAPGIIWDIISLYYKIKNNYKFMKIS